MIVDFNFLEWLYKVNKRSGLNTSVCLYHQHIQYEEW